MNRDIVWTTRFKKDYKLALKRNLNIELLDEIIRALSRGETLPEKNKDHMGVSFTIISKDTPITPLFTPPLSSAAAKSASPSG